MLILSWLIRPKHLLRSPKNWAAFQSVQKPGMIITYFITGNLKRTATLLNVLEGGDSFQNLGTPANSSSILLRLSKLNAVELDRSISSLKSEVAYAGVQCFDSGPFPMIQIDDVLALFNEDGDDTFIVHRPRYREIRMPRFAVVARVVEIATSRVDPYRKAHRVIDHPAGDRGRRIQGYPDR